MKSLRKLHTGKPYVQFERRTEASVRVTSCASSDPSDSLPIVDEPRKRVILIAASILAARNLSRFDGGQNVPATISAIDNAVTWAEKIMKEIDRRWPSPHGKGSQ